jgi:hypothetical protein
LTRGFIARAINTVAEKIDWTIVINPPATQQSFNNEVRLFKVPDPKTCDQKEDDRDCSSYHCAQKYDTRDCTACIVRGFGGHCIHRGDDPFCVTERRLQNAAYATEFGGCQLDAARLKGQCETEKAGQNVLYAAQASACRAGNELVRTIANAGGRVGRISGTILVAATGVVRINSIAVVVAWTRLVWTPRWTQKPLSMQA